MAQMSINNKDDDDSPVWLILMDQSQLVMTVIGLVPNIATSLTLIKNGQVGGVYSFCSRLLAGFV